MTTAKHIDENLSADDFKLVNYTNKTAFNALLNGIPSWRDEDGAYNDDYRQNAVATWVDVKNSVRSSARGCHGFLAETFNVELIGVYVRVGSVLRSQIKSTRFSQKASCHKLDRIVKEITPRFYEWLLNSSPYADCYVVKEIKEGMPYTFVRTDKPANLVMSAVVTSRFPHEYPEKMELWDRLVTKKGMNPNYAFLAVAGTHSIDGTKLYNSPICSDHCVINSEFSEEFMANFVAGNIDPLYALQDFKKSSKYRVYREGGYREGGRRIFNLFGKYGGSFYQRNLLKREDFSSYTAYHREYHRSTNNTEVYDIEGFNSFWALVVKELEKKGMPDASTGCFGKIRGYAVLNGAKKHVTARKASLVQMANAIEQVTKERYASLAYV